MESSKQKQTTVSNFLVNNQILSSLTG